MQFYRLPCHKESSSGLKKLILFFAGWGMDEKPFKHIINKEYDVVIFYNYTNFYFDKCAGANCITEISQSRCLIYNMFNQYDEINIIAWSMGVWGASMAFEKYFTTLYQTNDITANRKLLKKINKCIAINGTLFPISMNWGIPQDIYDKTIENLPAGLGKFNLRMCGNKSAFEKYNLCISGRNTHDIKQELINIKETFFLCNSINWNKTIISTKDNIFPTANQRIFWEDYIVSTQHSQNIFFEKNNFNIIEIDDAHYPFFRWNTWEEILGV